DVVAEEDVVVLLQRDDVAARADPDVAFQRGLALLAAVDEHLVARPLLAQAKRAERGGQPVQLVARLLAILGRDLERLRREAVEGGGRGWLVSTGLLGLGDVELDLGGGRRIGRLRAPVVGDGAGEVALLQVPVAVRQGGLSRGARRRRRRPVAGHGWGRSLR